MGRLRKTAHATAAAEYGPQRRSVARETRNQVRSIRSSQPALVGSINLARRQLRHSGLSPRDLSIAETELANRVADVGSSTALQVGQVRQDAQQQLVDLAQGQGQAESALLASLQEEARKQQQGIAEDHRHHAEDFRWKLAEAAALDKLGLGGAGMTPTQQREHHESHHNAAFYAKQYFMASKGGVTDPKTGEQLVPPGPHNWSDQVWNSLAEKVAGQKGVDSVADAQRAVHAIRAHVDPGYGAGASSLGGVLRALATVAAPTAAAVAPSLPSVPQFANPQLLEHLQRQVNHSRGH